MNFFAYPGSWIFRKATKFYFEGYGPEIHRKLHKWCCGRILKLFRLLQAKKILYKFLIFWVFLHIRGHEIFEKSPSSFLRVTSLKFIGNFKNGIADVFQSFLGCFEPKKILYKFLIFWVFLHIRGHGIFEKSLSSFLRVTSLKFIRNFKNGVADVFQSFLGCFEPKKIFYKFLIFWVFLHIRGHESFWKIPKFFFESYQLEIHRKLHKWCCGRILKLFRLFQAKKIFV